MHRKNNTINPEHPTRDSGSRETVQLEELTSINTLVKEIAASLSLTGTVRMTYDLIRAAVNPDLLVVYLVDGNKLVSQGEWANLPDLRQSKHHTIKIGECLCGWVAAQGSPIYVMDIQKDHRCNLDECKSAGIQSFAAIPLLNANRVEGILGLGSFTKRDFCHQAAYIETLAGYVGMSIRNAILQADINTYAEQLEYSLLAYEKSQKALKASEKKYRTLFENLQEGIWGLDTQAATTFINPSMARMLGYTIEEMHGNSIHDFMDEASGTICKQYFEQCKTGKARQQTFDFLKKDGSYLYALIEATPLFDDHATYTGCVISVMDITDWKKAEDEKRRLQIQLSESQKLDAIATLAGGIAHQFNNVLSTVNGSVELIEMDAPFQGIAPYTFAIKQAVARMTKLTNQLLSYARGGRYKEQQLRINDFIVDIIPLVRHRLKAGIRIETVLSPESLTVRADPTQLQMVLSEVLFNASEAIENRGSIRISISKRHVKKKRIVGQTSILPGLFACIKIQDDGRGMAPETCSRMFEPFFTTKFQGRGLGMAAAFGIICNHAGWISAKSKTDHGTTIEIHLPTEIATRVALTSGEPGIIPASGKETILLVDDEQAMLVVAAKQIEKLGYHVFAAETGEQALEIFKKKHQEIDLVILDLIMPQMGGGEVFDVIKKIDPTAKVLLSSGFSIDGEAKKVMARGCRGFIQKPFSMQRLSDSIHNILDKKPQ